MRNRTYGGVRGRKTKVGEKLLRFPPTRFVLLHLNVLTFNVFVFAVVQGKRKKVKRIWDDVVKYFDINV